MSIYEIERKFLVSNESWKKDVYLEKEIEQYYIDIEELKFYINMKKNYFTVCSKTFKLKLRLKDIEMKALKENLKNENKVVRFRKSNSKYIFTLKIDINEIGKNIEIERDIKEGLHNSAKSIASKGISKIRNLVKYEGYIFEVDEFLEHNEGLVLAEVEVSDLKYPEKLPSWIGKEVTGDIEYFNSSLAVINKV